MSEQRELPRDASTEAWLAIQKAKGGGYYSGGPFENFREGWGVVPFGKAHYLHVELEKYLVSACGHTWLKGPLTGPFAPLDRERCKRCEKIASGKAAK